MPKSGVNRLLPIAALLLIGCSAARHPQPDPLKIGAHADLRAVLPHLLSQYEAQTGIKIEATYAASGVLMQQSLAGAGFDLLVVAAPQFLRAPRRFLKVAVLAHGRLALYGRNLPNSFEGLQNVKEKILIPNPSSAPFGKAALTLLEAQPWYGRIADKIVYGGSVSDARAAVESGAADISVISVTQARVGKLHRIELGEAEGVEVIGGAETERGKALLDYLLSEPCAKVMAESGLLVAKPK